MGQSANHSKSTQQNSIMLIAAVMGMGISFIVDVYAMINLPGNYLVIGIVSLIFLVFTFLLVRSALKLHMMKLSRQEEVYAELFKSSKATYLMMRKSFGEMEDTVNNIGEVVKAPIAEFMDEQKNISQITVNRSKENADALMNSNDKLLDKFFEFETTLEEFEEQMISKQKELMDSSVREITLKQQELSSVIKDSEFEIKKEMLAMGRPMAQPQVEPVYAPVPEEIPVVEEVPIVEELPMTEMTPTVEEVPVVEETSVMDTISDLLSEPVFEDEITLGFEPEEESEISLGIDNFESEAETEISLGFDDFEAETPVIEEAPVMPDLSDPNKMMSPDDIAALLASMGGGSETPTQEEAVAEPIMEEAPTEEVPEEKEEATEKPPMPDLSDPNKMMSPEDIAALLANL